MKQIIDGMMYNTKTATIIGEYSNGLGESDFRYCWEDLYVTKKGNFFLDGEGGSMSKYSRPCGNMTGGGSRIIALTKEEALEWCEAHLDADEFEEYFELEEA